MLTRLREIAYDSVAKKFVSRDQAGRKVQVSLGTSPDLAIKTVFFSHNDSAPDTSLGSNLTKLLTPDFVDTQKGGLSLDADEPLWVKSEDEALYWVEANVDVRTSTLIGVVGLSAVSYAPEIEYAQVTPTASAAVIDKTSSPFVTVAANGTAGLRIEGPVYCPAGGHVGITAVDYNGNADGREVSLGSLTIKRIA